MPSTYRNSWFTPNVRIVKWANIWYKHHGLVKWFFGSSGNKWFHKLLYSNNASVKMPLIRIRIKHWCPDIGVTGTGASKAGDLDTWSHCQNNTRHFWHFLFVTPSLNSLKKWSFLLRGKYRSTHLIESTNKKMLCNTVRRMQCLCVLP